MRNVQDQGATGKFVGAVENAVLILRCLAHAAGPLGVAAIARDTSLNVSTSFNILRTLSKEGLVVFDPESKTYRIGLGILELSTPLLGANQADLIRPELERLSGEHNALIGLWKITPDDRIVLVERVVDARVVRVDMGLGARLPAFVGAVGRCIAATRNLDRTELQRRFRALRWQDAPSFEAYAADVAGAAKTGYAVDRGQLFKGLDIAASVVRDHDGEARFGISGIAIAGQLNAEELERLAIAIRQTGALVSANLYGRPRSVAGRPSAAPAAPASDGRDDAEKPEEENVG